ncbi:conserved hypothetical protein [Leuconostoc carnosum]|nr:conserved hypothetical protein [Leuconostoc carnosum]SPO33975.1 conserved hypothetical protein [Leuconostoc carnosum]
MLNKVGLDGGVINYVNQAIDDIHGQTIKYIRHYIEIEFIQKRIDYGFDQFNTFLRLVVDNG